MDPHSKSDVRKAREAERVEGRDIDEFLRQMLALRQGRTYFWNLLASCGIGRNPFSADALTMAFAAGEMNVGQRILADIIRVAPERYIEMMGEQNERRSTSDDAGTSDSGSSRTDNPEPGFNF